MGKLTITINLARLGLRLLGLVGLIALAWTWVAVVTGSIGYANAGNIAGVLMSLFWTILLLPVTVLGGVVCLGLLFG